MKDMNRVFLIGRLGGQPELTISKTGKPYSRLSVATHRTWMNANDQREDKTEWHSVFVWGPLAEHCCRTLKKGALVFVEGSLSYWKVADKDYRNSVHGFEVKFLGYGEPKPAVDEFDKASARESIDNPAAPRNHNAVAHPA